MEQFNVKRILRAVCLCLLVMVAAEFGIMLILHRAEISVLAQAIVDPLLLTLIVLPLSYVVLYRPVIAELLQALNHNQNQAQSFIQSASDAIVGTNRRGEICYWNDAAGQLFGYSASSAIGRQINELLVLKSDCTPDTAPGVKQFQDFSESYITGKTYEFTAIKNDGMEFPVELTFSSYKFGGEAYLISGIRDVTERQQTKSKLQAYNERLRRGLISTIQVVVKAAEARDPYTAGHQSRVSRLAREIAMEMALDGDQIEGIRLGALVHDIGKIQIPSEILSKPGKLSVNEFELVKDHSLNGYQILQGIESPWPISEIAWQHHERLDGSGYPRGLRGDDICLEARIVAVADVVEAISSHRPYRPALGVEAALEEISKGSGKYFDPDVVNACLKVFAEKKFSFNAAKTPRMEEREWSYYNFDNT